MDRHFTCANVLLLLSSVGVVALERMSSALITPILAQWKWAAVSNNDGISVFDSNSNLSLTTNYSVSNLRLVQAVSNTSVNQSEQVFSLHKRMSTSAMAVLIAKPLVNTLLSPITGMLGDRVSHELPMIFGLILNLFMSTVFAFSSSFEAILFACLLQGIAGALNVPNALASVTSLFKPQTKEGKISLGLIMTANMFSFIGPAIEGFLYENLGQKLCFLILLVPFDIILICGKSFSLYNKTRNVKPDQRHLHLEINSSADATDPISRREKCQALFRLFMNPKLIVVAGTYAIVWIPRKCIESTIALWMDARFSSGPSTVGLVLSLAAVSVPAANIFGAYFASIQPNYTHLMTAFSVVCCSVPVSVLFLSPNPVSISACFAVYVFFASAARYGAIRLLSIIAENTSGTPRGRFMAIAYLLSTMMDIIGPVIATELYRNFGFESLCLSIGPLCSLSAPLLFVFHKKLNQRVKPSSKRYSLMI